MNYTTYDLILQTTGEFEVTLAEFQNNRPIQDDLFLGPDLWVGHLPKGVALEVLMDACEPAGHNFRPIRQYGCRYSVVRKLESDSYPSYSWDEDLSLSRILFLSRLIHPTTISSHYSARLIFENDELKTIIPGRVQGVGTYVWLVAKTWRDWLTVGEGERLAAAIPLYSVNAPERVRRARGHLDHSFHSFYLDQKTASIVAAFESLLKIGRQHLTRQFVTRAQQLAKLCGESISAKDAEQLYDDRSSYVHGAGVAWSDIDDELIARYQRFERTIRAALFRASTDKIFAGYFGSDDSVRSLFNC
jgi:hypothetical protein